MMGTLLGNILPSLLDPVLKALFPDPAERAAAELKVATLQQSGALREAEVAMSAIVMEAQSGDPWTSRARPSFLYVVYAYILGAVPMGILYWVDPGVSASVTDGVRLWLNSIPEPMWWLFGAGYLGYSGARSFDKSQFAKGWKVK